MSDSAPPPPPPPPPAAPPPPPTGPVGGPAPAGPYSATNALSYGWNKFKANPAEMLVPVLIVGAITIVISILLQVVLAATLLGTHSCTQTALGVTVDSQCGPGLVVRLLGSALVSLIVSLISQALGAGLIKNALNIADGKAASVGEVFAWATKPQVITAALLVSVITAIGSLLCYVPGIIAAFLLNWTMFYVVDKGAAPVDALKQSVSFVTSHLGETLVFWILGAIAIIVGLILCLVGLLVAAPVVLIGAAYTFRVLHNEPVSPAPA